MILKFLLKHLTSASLIIGTLTSIGQINYFFNHLYIYNNCAYGLQRNFSYNLPFKAVFPKVYTWRYFVKKSFSSAFVDKFGVFFQLGDIQSNILIGCYNAVFSVYYKYDTQHIKRDWQHFGMLVSQKCHTNTSSSWVYKRKYSQPQAVS